ncbi:MAG TPA: hypothetical protein VK195_17830 [Burkholderiaceae bacterium]|nr:hypothetical protein [Burkholderiaceae bacterium]
MSTFQKTTRRRLAAALLFVWLFALVNGMANACVLGGELAWPASHTHDDAAALHGHEAHDGHEQAPHPSAPGPQDHDEACRKFCEDGRSAVNLAAKDLGSPGSLLPLLMPFATLAWTPGAEQPPGAPPAEVPPCMTGPPIPLRLLRLAL